MADKIVIGLMPPNFNKILIEYQDMWDNHINWVKESLTHVSEICNKNPSDETQTPNQKKNKKKRQTGLTTDSKVRSSINILNSIRNNKNARVTRSTSRILKQLNLVKDSNNLMNNDLDLIVKQDQLIEKRISEEILCDNKVVSKKEDDSENINNENVLKVSENDKKINNSSLKEKKSENETDKEKINEKCLENVNKNKSEISKIVSSKKILSEEKNLNSIEEVKKLDENEMIWSPAKKEVENKTNQQIPLIITEPSKVSGSEDEWLTEDESNVKINNSNKSTTKQKKNSLKRGAIKKLELRPTPKIKRNKTNEFSTPQSMKKFSKIPYKVNSSSKQLKAIAKPNLIPSSITKQNEFVSKIKKPEEKNIESSSQAKNTNLISSNSSSLSHLSLKSCPATIQQPNKVLSRNLSNNSEGKQRCFAESTLKQKLEEEKRRKILEEKIAKEEEAKKKKENFLKQRILETKLKREERERKVREGKLLHEKEAEFKRIAENKKRLEANLKEKEMIKLADLKKRQQLIQKVQEQKINPEGDELVTKNTFDPACLEESHDLKVFESIEKAIEFENLNDKVENKLVDKLELPNLNDEVIDKDFNKQLILKDINNVEKPSDNLISNSKSIKQEKLELNTEVKIDLPLESNLKEKDSENTFDSIKEASLESINLKLEMTNDSSMSADEVSIKETNQTFIKDLKTNALSSTFIKPVEKLVKTPLPSINESPQSYDISDLRSDDDDDDEYLYKSVNKKRPLWTRGDEFMRSIQQQYGLSSRARENKIKSIFSTIESIVPLNEIFSENKEFVSKRYERRTSSACWSSPPATYIDKSFSQFY